MSKSNRALAKKVKSKEEESLNTLYNRVKNIIDEKKSSVAEITGRQIGHLANRVESEALLAHQLDKMGKLERSLDNLCFGRIFLDDARDYYIGKIGVTDEAQDNLLLDWRTPVAGKFYQASSVNPNGVACKRIFRSTQKDFKVQINSLSDEEFIKNIVSEVVLSEDSALKDALNRKRTGKMSEIVATIESEQDRIMRLPTAGTLVIQGAPGTGKTVVGLHRAAYLLYVERERLKDRGVLVVGPNGKFLSYIDQVLPLLGEYDVDLALIESLVASYPIAYQDDKKDSDAKNEVAFVEAVERAVKNLVNLPDSALTLDLTGERVTISRNELERALRGAEGQDYNYNETRDIFIKKVMESIVRKLKDLREIEDEDFGEEEFHEVMEELRDSEVARRALNLMYMPYSAEQVLWKLSREKRLWKGSKIDGTKVLGKFSENYRKAQYSLNDILLLDVLAGKLGEYDPLYRDGHKEGYVKSNILVDPKLYGHLVADEAQEITYLGWRALGRRVIGGSATILGDKFQQDAKVADISWENAALALGSRNVRVEELKINYRTPMEINELSLKYLERHGSSREVSSIRDQEDCVNVFIEKLDVSKIFAEYNRLKEDGLTVVVAPERYSSLFAGLEMDLVSARESKGVEWDHIIIVDPEAIEAEGISNLYVSLTRATQSLTIFQEVKVGFPWEAIYAL